jgi:hypothetical protein
MSTGKWPTDILLVCLALTMNASRVFETPYPVDAALHHFITIAVSASVKLCYCIRPALA